MRLLTSKRSVAFLFIVKWMENRYIVSDISFFEK